ncbi:MAG: carboxypeptidase regulatory-like domain-containing protein [Saprospiraceae bacterium]
MNLIPRLRLGAFCYALSIPAFFFIQFLISDASPIFPGLPVKSQIAAVTDTCAPVIECINGLAGELLPLEPNSDPDGDGDIDFGAFTVDAADLIENAVSSCSNTFHYTAYRMYEIESGEVVPHAGDPDSITFICDDCGTVAVRVYVWDNLFNPDAVQPDGTVGGSNYSFCETEVIVQGNLYDACHCGGGHAIYGFIKTTENEAVKDVSVQLSGNSNNENLTSQLGTYEFYPISYPFGPNNSYTVTPSLNTNHKNGLSQFDAILIRRHILGIEPLNTPYKRIAADVNNNQKITIADVIQIQRLILEVDTVFAQSTSWRFVRSDYVFPVPTNPWFEVFPESKTFNTYWDDNDQDFIAIKIGDVNSSAATSLLLPGKISPEQNDERIEQIIQPFLQPAPEYGATIKAVTDTCAPSIQCLEGLTFEAEPTEPGGSGGDIIAILQGADLVADASSTCSNSLQFSVYRADDVVSGNVVPGPNQDSVILNCGQDCQGTVILWVYVWDDNFNPDAVQPDGTIGGPNYAWCETYVLITGAQFCECEGSSITISGYVKTESGVGVNHVSVSLTGSASETTSTDASGYYEFNNLTPGGSYTISPEKDVFHLNGVSVADAILLSKHILGLQPLGSPYKMIAGDVNNDKKLTTIDLIHLRKLILAIDTAFVANTSWRFVWAGYDFPVPTNPWFEAFIEGGGPDFDFEEDTQIDFVAIKIGDVNSSANTN